MLLSGIEPRSYNLQPVILIAEMTARLNIVTITEFRRNV
jgi:hypothetical protein